MAIATSILVGAAVVGVAASVGSAIEQERDANRDIEAAQKKQTILNGQLENLKKNRQPIKNPYAGLTNQYENLGVAVKSAQFQAEEADIALANTLDTIRQTGSGAAGATALAQAALQSKRGISASLEQQEATNQKLTALYDEQRYLEMAAQQSKDDAQQGYYQVAGDLASTVLSAGGTFGVK